MQILELLVQQLNANLVQKAITISVTDEAKKWILDKTLVDRSYGARPLRRALQRYVEDPLSEALIAGSIAQRPAFLEVYLENNQLFYRPVVRMVKRRRRPRASCCSVNSFHFASEGSANLRGLLIFAAGYAFGNFPCRRSLTAATLL